jgi:hypothetical protein
VEKKAAENSAEVALIFLFSIKEQWYPTPELKSALMLIRQVDTAPGLQKNDVVYMLILLTTSLCICLTVSASSSTLTSGGPALRRYSGDVL